MSEKMTHWKSLTDSPYLGAYSLQPGEEKVLTIAKVGKEGVVGSDGKKEDCVVAHFKESGVKPMILNATNMKTIEKKVAETPFIEKWVGVRVQIYVEKVRAFGDVVDALRVRPHKPKAAAKIVCEECRKEITPAFNRSAQQLAEYTRQNYGKAMCAECASAAAQARAEQETLSVQTETNAVKQTEPAEEAVSNDTNAE